MNSYKNSPLSLREIVPLEHFYFANHLNPEHFDNPSSFKVLDWGCGRGITVVSLLKQGFDAYGVEIDPMVLKQSQKLFDDLGWNHQDRMQLIGQKNQTKFPPDYFDLIISDQVFEHVENIEELAEEMFRISKPGATLIHRWPAKYSLLEPHLRMPFVHWLPKNKIRKGLIFANLLLDNNPGWDLSVSLNAQTNLYYKYLVDKTYYRKLDYYSKLFSEKFDLEIRGNLKTKSKVLDFLAYRLKCRESLGKNISVVILTLTKKV